MVSASFSSTFRLMEAIEAEGDTEHMARACLTLIGRDLLSGQPPASLWQGRNGHEEGAPSDVLSLVTANQVRSAPDAPESDLARVTYARQGSRLIRFAVRNLHTTSWDAVEQSDVAEGVVGFNVRYYSGLAQVWTDEWDQSLKKLPKAVLVELTLIDSRRDTRTYSEWLPIPIQS